MKTRQVILLFLITMLPFGLEAQHLELQKANELYRQEAFEEARVAYEALADQGLQSKALFYNLGNTYYRLGAAGQAVLHYEKALLLAPKDREVLENLAFVKSQLEGEIISLDVFPLIAFWQNLRDGLSSNTWTFIGLLLFWGGVAGFLVWLLVPRRKQKIRGFIGGLTALLLCTIPFLLAAGQKEQKMHSNKAVIVHQEAALYASPSEGAEVIYPLFEGATVRTVEQLEDWCKVNLANGYQGWIPVEKLARVRL
jgi:tetratricopeptide (TPR) repeat protein